MAITVTTSAVEVGRDVVRAYGTLALAGNYAAGGMAVSFGGKVSGLANESAPVDVRIEGIAGYTYRYVKSTKKVKVLLNAGFTPAGTNDSATPPIFTGTAVAAAPQAELAAAAYPSGVTGDTVSFVAVFSKA